jgi:Ni,Fe-hydrogenase III small subunit
MFQLLKQILLTGIRTEAPPSTDDTLRVAPPRLPEAALARLRRSSAIRHVDAGSCNGCELEIEMLGNCYYNLEKMGMKFISSPRHADMLLVTGPVSRNMEAALKHVYEAIPQPNLVVAVGECACTGGIFGESYASCGRVASVIAVDVQVPGCPPTPTAIMQGILTAVAAPKADT